MPQATFVIKEPTSKEETLIYLLYRFNGSKLKYSTGQKINPKLWNSEKQRAKELRSSKEWETLNFLLDELESTTNNIYRTLLLEGITLTPELLRTRLNQVGEIVYCFRCNDFSIVFNEGFKEINYRS